MDAEMAVVDVAEMPQAERAVRLGAEAEAEVQGIVVAIMERAVQEQSEESESIVGR